MDRFARIFGWFCYITGFLFIVLWGALLANSALELTSFLVLFGVGDETFGETEVFWSLVGLLGVVRSVLLLQTGRCLIVRIRKPSAPSWALAYGLAALITIPPMTYFGYIEGSLEVSLPGELLAYMAIRFALPAILLCYWMRSRWLSQQVATP